jgi:MFS family permease
MRCGAIPAIVAGHLQTASDALRIMIVGAFLCTMACILECVALYLWLFVIGATLMAIGQGFALTNIGVYICEIAPSRSHGKFVSLPQFGAAIGVYIKHFSCYGSIQSEGNMSWRLPYILQAALSTVWAVGSIFLPERPRWHILHERHRRSTLRCYGPKRCAFECAC